MANRTSPLLINEPPLQILPSLAVAIGLNEAIVVQQVHYWLGLSANTRDGRVWVFKTYPEWRAEFPFWSEDTIGRTIRKLESAGLLLSTDKYNQIATDRTKWYSIDYDVLDNRGLLLSRAPQIATVEDGKLQPSRAPQIATLLPETTQRIPPETLLPAAPNENGSTWIFQLYLDTFSEAVSSGEHDDLRDLAQMYTQPDVRDAMRLTQSANARRRIARKVAYVRGILQDWAVNGKPEIVPTAQQQAPKLTPIKPRKVFR